MANKSLPSIKPGILRTSADLLEGHITTHLLDRFVKGDDEPIFLSDMAGLFKTSVSKIASVLNAMSGSGRLARLDNQDWHHVDAFALEGFAFGVTEANIREVTEDDEDDDETQGRLELGDIPAVAAPTREQIGRDRQIRDGVIYWASVKSVHQSDGSDGLLYAELLVTARDIDDNETEPIEKYLGQFATPNEAWAFWDQYLPEEGTPDVSPSVLEASFRQWFASLNEDQEPNDMSDTDDPIFYIEPRTFAYALELNVARTEDGTQFYIDGAYGEINTEGHEWPDLHLVPATPVQADESASEPVDDEPEQSSQSLASKPALEWAIEMCAVASDSVVRVKQATFDAIYHELGDGEGDPNVLKALADQYAKKLFRSDTYAIILADDGDEFYGLDEGSQDNTTEDIDEAVDVDDEDEPF